MHRFMTIAGIALAVLALVAVSPVSAQVVVYYPPAPVTYSYYAPPVYYAPAPVTYSYYAPPVSTVAYYPTTTYYPATVYSPSVVYSPGVVTTRSYVGLGIFRPRGVYTQSYYTPYVSGYYYPAYYRY